MNTIFLDFDDVICLGKPYGGFDVFSGNRPLDLWDRLFDAGCKEVLHAIHVAHQPGYVLTTSWIDHADRAGFDQILRQSGLGFVADGLYSHWNAPQDHRVNRSGAIRRWLQANPHGRFLVLDDETSGVGLQDWPQAILCQVNTGLTPAHIAIANDILDQDFILPGTT